MNFNFGTPKTTGGFTLSTPTSTPVVSNPGLTFAAGDNKGLATPQPAKAPAFGLSFGAAPNTGFQLGTPATTTPSTLTFGGGTPQNVSFNAPASTTTSTGANTSTLTGFLLGSSLGQTSAPSLFSGTLTTTAAPTLSLSTPASSAPSFNLGSTLGNTAVTSSTTGASGFLLGATGSAALTLGTSVASTVGGNTFTLEKVATTSTSGTPSLSLSATKAPFTGITNTTVSTAASVTPAGSFTFAQLEEALNKWTLELEDQGKMFINQALQLNAWDRLVIANGEKILTLNNGIEKVKQQQQQLDHELDFVLAQQRELEECILPLEKELKDIPITDQDRNHTYQMAENMDTQLKQMSEDLKEIIEHLNESNKTEDTNDPVAQIGRILNAHMNSLQWIDRNTAQIGTFLDQISKMHDIHRRDNERSFHLTYE